MIDRPTVSVILPVWNGERFIRTAIDSVLGQSLVAFELIVVDDGSTDRTREIVQEYVERDSRVRQLARPHEGLVAALNAAIASARAPYVARMDADDIARPLRLERQIAYLDAHPECVVVGSHVQIIDELGSTVADLAYPTAHDAIARAVLSTGPAFCHPSVVLRASILREVGGYRVGTFPAEDADLWLRLLDRGRFANLPDPLLAYRRHPSTVSARDAARPVVRRNALVSEARAARGLAPVRLDSVPGVQSAEAAYHNECARFMTKGRQRRAAFQHARASLRSAPFQSGAYVAIAACLLPAFMMRALLAVRSSARRRRS